MSRIGIIDLPGNWLEVAAAKLAVQMGWSIDKAQKYIIDTIAYSDPAQIRGHDLMQPPSGLEGLERRLRVEVKEAQPEPSNRAQRRRSAALGRSRRPKKKARY